MSGPLFPSAALSSNEATVPAPQRPQAAVTVSSVLPHRGNSTNGGAEVSATETSNSSSTSSGLTAVASTDSSKAEKQLARVETEDVTASDDDAAPSSSSSSSSQDNARCPRDASKCVTCSEDKLTGWADWVEAAKLTWQRQRSHLFTAWVHVPLGVTTLLVIVWGLNLAIEVAPFRFPAAVLTAFGLFASLLLLDWFSERFPGAPLEDPEADEEGERTPTHKRKRKRFVDPVMRLLAPPCDFCLRNMSVMFTPSFILIPAREVIPGREIGLIAGWFAASQLAAFIIPILLNWGLNWLWKVPARMQYRLRAARWESKRKEIIKSRRNSTSSRRGSTAGVHNGSRRGSTATIAGLEFEKGVSFSSISKLGPVASGLAGLTATITAPVAHIQMDFTDDEMRHFDAVAIEQARQQGDPAVARMLMQAHGGFTPRSDVSYFSHAHAYQQHHHLHSPRTPRTPGTPHDNIRRPRSRSREPNGPRTHSARRGPRSASPRTRPAVSAAGDALPNASPYEPTIGTPSTAGPLKSTFPLSIPTMSNGSSPAEYRFPNAASPPPPTVAFELHLPTAAGLRVAEATEHSPTSSRRGSVIETVKDLSGATARNSLSFSLTHGTPSSQPLEGSSNSGIIFNPISYGSASAPPNSGRDLERRSSQIEEADEDTEDNSDNASDMSSNYGPDAIERLSSWMGDLITPIVYFIVFLVGLPLWFIYNFALPLFLGINLLCFIAGITIIPAKVRRFLHPILSCSIATVLLIWAFGAMNGMSISEALGYYSNGARYTVLWAPSGYTGPVPGAGDLLFSTLDAGIVALAIPMYRYRKDLRDNFVRMIVALVPCAALSLFFWPWIARLMGMDDIRALALAARFMSTPLAIELANNVGADESIVVILVVITGIIFAVFKDQLFRLMRVTDDMTIGLTMGSTSGAIGASSLISKPRQMAIASLSFILFGTLLLIATAIPPIVGVVQQLAGPRLV